jgi:hypothetical protein
VPGAPRPTATPQESASQRPTPRRRTRWANSPPAPGQQQRGASARVGLKWASPTRQKGRVVRMAHSPTGATAASFDRCASYAPPYQDLKSAFARAMYGFESRPRHREIVGNSGAWPRALPHPRMSRYETNDGFENELLGSRQEEFFHDGPASSAHSERRHRTTLGGSSAPQAHSSVQIGWPASKTSSPPPQSQNACAAAERRFARFWRAMLILTVASK